MRGGICRPGWLAAAVLTIGPAAVTTAQDVYGRSVPEEPYRAARGESPFAPGHAAPELAADTRWPAPIVPAVQRPDEPASQERAAAEPAAMPRPITPPARRISSPTPGDGRRASAAGSVGTTVAALVVVVLAILGGARLWKKHAPRVAQGLPPDALEFLGKRHIDPRQVVYLVRLGSRILVLGSSPAGLNTLAEVTDPIEVDLLAGLCRRRDGISAAQSAFRPLLQRQTTVGRSGSSRTVRPREPAEEVHA